MANLLIYSDLHIGASRVDDDKVIDTINFINETANIKKVDGIINLGDTLDCSGGRKQILSPSIVKLLNMLDFSQHYILRGNHEYHVDGDILSLLRCKHFIDKPSVFFDCLFIPYTKAIDKNLYPTDSYKYVFSHCDFHGGLYDNGHEYKGKNNKILSGVNYDRLFIGHYHIRQYISRKVLAVGAVQSRIKSMCDDPLGITLFDTSTEKIEFIENPYSYFQISEGNQKIKNSSEFLEISNDEVLEERQSIIDSITTLARSDELITDFFTKKGLSSEIIKALTKGELPNDFK